MYPIDPPRDENELEELLSRPSPGVVEALSRTPGDVVLLGAGGKMGPSLALMVRRATDQLGDRRRVIAVSRNWDSGVAARLWSAGVEVVHADLLDRRAREALPDAPNVIYMAGQKFGTREFPAATWVTNTVLPALVAERYRGARIVAFSTGNVYGFTTPASGGSREGDVLQPVGEYGWSALARERVLEYASRSRGTPMALVRLNYAVDLRYGVLVDLALAVLASEPIDLSMGYVNVIWQGDACSHAIQCLPLASVPPLVVNVTGPEILAVRDLALELGRLLDREPMLVGVEEPDALLSNTALAQASFGPPLLSTDRLLQWVAAWVGGGRRTLPKRTRFQERGGAF
jgi:nucleoside-diphosphate-sugar epimerase